MTGGVEGIKKNERLEDQKGKERKNEGNTGGLEGKTMNERNTGGLEGKRKKEKLKNYKESEIVIESSPVHKIYELELKYTMV